MLCKREVYNWSRATAGQTARRKNMFGACLGECPAADKEGFCQTDALWKIHCNGHFMFQSTERRMSSINNWAALPSSPSYTQSPVCSTTISLTIRCTSNERVYRIIHSTQREIVWRLSVPESGNRQVALRKAFRTPDCLYNPLRPPLSLLSSFLFLPLSTS